MKNKIAFLCLLSLFVVLLYQIQPILSNAANSGTNSTRSSNTIAVAAVGDLEISEISMIAGKAPYYLIFDENGVFLKAIKNPGQSNRRNSSAVVVDLLLKESCKIAFAGKFGEKLRNKLNANQIEFHERQGIAKSVVQKFVSDAKTPQRTP